MVHEFLAHKAISSSVNCDTDPAKYLKLKDNTKIREQDNEAPRIRIRFNVPTVERTSARTSQRVVFVTGVYKWSKALRLRQ